MPDSQASPEAFPEAYRETWLKAADQFNTHQFWEAHETLEPFWHASEPPAKTLIQGVIQAAAACVHVSKNNRKGAVSLFHQALEKLQPAEAIAAFHHWFNLSEFVIQCEQAYQHALQAPTLETMRFPTFSPFPN